MKVNEREKQILSDAIDKMNEGLDAVIQLYNDAEEDQPFIQFDEDTIQIIEKARNAYGTAEIDERINKIVKEILSLLPLEQNQALKNEK